MQPRRHRARESASRYRARMRAQGLRPLQLWVPDTRSPKFAAECRRQSRSIARNPERDLDRVTVEPSAANGLKKVSQVMVDKPVSVKRDQLGKPFRRIEDEAMLRVNRTLAVWVGLA